MLRRRGVHSMSRLRSVCECEALLSVFKGGPAYMGFSDRCAGGVRTPPPNPPKKDRKPRGWYGDFEKS